MIYTVSSLIPHDVQDNHGALGVMYDLHTLFIYSYTWVSSLISPDDVQDNHGATQGYV